LRYVFDKLFRQRQGFLMKHLWQAVSRDFPQPFTLPSPPIPFSSGFGFQWVSPPSPGVLVHIREAPLAGRYLELDLRASSANESVPLSHYFPTTPRFEYALEAQVMAPNTAGSEVRLEIWSPGRLLGGSPPIRRFPSWRRIEIPFQTNAGDEVLQLRVVSRPARRKESRGGFFLGAIRVRWAHDDARSISLESVEHTGVQEIRAPSQALEISRISPQPGR
jgi:hypothetical protein